MARAPERAIRAARWHARDKAQLIDFRTDWPRAARTGARILVIAGFALFTALAVPDLAPDRWWLVPNAAGACCAGALLMALGTWRASRNARARR
jgi:uncharacterized membrane protein